MNPGIEKFSERFIFRRFDESGQMTVRFRQSLNLIQKYRLAGSAQPQENLRPVMFSQENALHGDLGIRDNFVPPSQLGRL